ncbi:MAG: four helix bundle protein [Planctomycetota bacterium]|nr:MAG: four helix bundle protein [Planctomycetota bacterium]
MARFHQLRIYHLARQVLREVVTITEENKGCGDLHSQIRRAAISVISNICEGCSAGNDVQFARYLRIARASCNEVQGQLDILCDLGSIEPDHEAIDRCDHLGRSISSLIRRLSG